MANIAHGYHGQTEGQARMSDLRELSRAYYKTLTTLLR